MARTTFSGPVKSDNGFEGSISATIVTAASATVTNLTATSLNIGASTTITAAAFSGVIGSNQLGYIPVKVNGTTKYIALYESITP